MKRMFACIVLMLTILSSQAFSQDTSSVVVPKSMLTTEQLAKVNESKTSQAVQTANDVVAIGKATGWGKEIGEGVNGALSALTVNADKFAKTGVGRFTMWMVAFKILGSQVIRLFLALLIMTVITSIFAWMWRDNFTTHRVLVKHTMSSPNTPEHKEYEVIQPDPEIQIQRAVYAAIWVVIMLIATAVGGC